MNDSTNGRWQTVEGRVRDLSRDPDATEFEKAMTEFRVAVRTLDGLRYGCRVLVETTRLQRARFDLYGDVLDRLVRDIEVGLAREGQVAA